MMERLTDTLWRYHDDTASTSYLVVGKERAAMIDCGSGGKPVMPLIRAVTDLPVILLLTHAHPDHYGCADEFEEVWLHESDVSALSVFEPTFSILGVKPLDRNTLRSFADGHVFDLGGETLMACALRGHTPGSVVFVAEKQKCMFSGDAVGSGDIVLMSVPLADDLSAYKRSLEEFLARSEPWSDYTWHGGHCHQSDRGEGVPPNELCRELLQDMVLLCGRVLDGSCIGERTYERFAPNGEARRAYLGRAGIVYTDEQVK